MSSGAYSNYIFLVLCHQNEAIDAICSIIVQNNCNPIVHFYIDFNILHFKEDKIDYFCANCFVANRFA